MEIKETCRCGAEFYVKDHTVFGNECKWRYKEFLEAHKICRERTDLNIHLPIDVEKEIE